MELKKYTGLFVRTLNWPTLRHAHKRATRRNVETCTDSHVSGVVTCMPGVVQRDVGGGCVVSNGGQRLAVVR